MSEDLFGDEFGEPYLALKRDVRLGGFAWGGLRAARAGFQLATFSLNRGGARPIHLVSL